MKVVVTGSSGLIGSVLVPALVARGHEVLALYHGNEPQFRSPKVTTQKLDLRDAAQVERLVLDLFPGAIINCAAYSSQDEVAKDEAAAEKINVSLPRQLAMLSRHVGARLLHLSTDMVFDGGQEAAYRSTDKPNPLNLYGQMKLLAEREVLRYAAEVSVVLRVTIVSGNSPSGLRGVHEKMIAALAAGQPKVKLLTNEYRQPVSNVNVADVLTELLERPTLSGLFHWSGVDRLSRYEIGRRMLGSFGLSEKWLEAAEGNDPTRAPDLALERAPLEGKIKTRAERFDDQLEHLRLIEPLRAWVEANRDLDVSAEGTDSSGQQGGQNKIERFVEGQDF